MFFVVYSINVQKFFIIPSTWVMDLVWENHVNRSLNKNQFYRCYWTSNQVAWINGVPDRSFRPDFMAPIGTIFPSDENCYICRLSDYAGK